MRIVELNLRAYGPFTSKVLSFGNESGLHILFGPNEAGKSSALRALRGVLFGIDGRDAHLHPADMLRVGLKIHTQDGQALEVERRKGKGLKSLVFSSSGKPVPVDEWTRVLPVSDPDLFQQMFGLDYQRLIDGGRELANFKGDIGESVLAASGDLGETVAKIQAYQERASAIYAPQASSRQLNKALREFKDAEARIRSQRFTSHQYKTAVARATELENELRSLGNELVRASEQRSHLTRLQTAAPHVELLSEAQAELDSLAGAILLPPSFEKQYGHLNNGREIAATRRQKAQFELNLLLQRLSNIPRQPEVAGLLTQIDQLKEQAGQIQKARLDLPKREMERDDCIKRRLDLCIDWKLDPEALPQITAEPRRRIDTLAKQYLALQSKREELPRRISTHRSRLGECELSLTALPPAVDTTAIKQILKQIPAKRQSGAETQRLRQDRDNLKADSERDIAALALWNGTAEQLEALSVPLLASLGDMQARFARQQTLLEQAMREKEGLIREQETTTGALLQLDKQGALPTEDDLQNARARRDLGWEAVKESWLQGLGNDGPSAGTFLAGEARLLPDAFEASIALVDSLADRLWREAERVEKKRTALREHETLNVRITEKQRSIESLQKENDALFAAWHDLWKDTGITPRSPQEMSAWIEQRKLLIENLRNLRSRDRQVVEAEAEDRSWCDSLTQVLQAEPGQSLASLVGAAETRISGVETVSKQRDALNERIREAQTNLAAELEQQRLAEAELQTWRKQWAETILDLPMAVNTEPATVQELVQVIGKVKTATDEIGALQHRIDAMRRDENVYAEQVQALARQAARPDFLSLDPLIASGELQKLARTAHDNEMEADGLVKEKLRREQDLDTSTSELERFDANLDDLLKHSGIGDANFAPEIIEQSKQKTELTKRVRANMQALAQSAADAPLDSFLDEVKTDSPEARRLHLQDLEQRIEGLEKERAEKTREQERIQNDFRLKEDAATVNEAACQKYSAAARIEQLLMEYLRNYVGAELLTKAVALYSDKHQDPLLKLASDYFERLTCAAFSGIAVKQEQNGRVLRAVRENGEVLGVDCLSDGTRDQLFLALRLAYIDNHCRVNEPCPVILDDVLMAFDDRRASAALSALRRLSERTQVLIFTHHAHHVKMAEQLLRAEVHLHDLAPGFNLAA